MLLIPLEESSSQNPFSERFGDLCPQCMCVLHAALGCHYTPLLVTRSRRGAAGGRAGGQAGGGVLLCRLLLAPSMSSTMVQTMGKAAQEPSNSNSMASVAYSKHEVHIRTAKKAFQAQQHINNFVGAVLMEKPDDVYSFAKGYFADMAVICTRTDTDQQEVLVTTSLPPLIIAGPSGVGKGTIIKKLFQRFSGQLEFSVSHTTRKPRIGEVPGVDYFFTTKEDMKKAVSSGDFIEWAEVHGQMYGTSCKSVKAVCDAGKICVLDIDVQGVMKVKGTSLGANCVFIMPPSLAVLEQRLRSRNTESEEGVLKRLSAAQQEMDFGQEKGMFEKIVINDDLNAAVDELAQQLSAWYPGLTCSS
jgi:guanylate kinase